MRYIGLSVAAALLAWSSVAFGQAVDLLGLSLEELMSIEVSLTSRKEERLFETPSAVFVLTREDLRRSGATSIPDALRLVLGMQVGHIDANKWAVSARGFADRFTNKMPVLIDGRTVYSPLFSGVFWEMRDVLLEDVERIEVVRGPGTTLWGANAVNGIINVVTVKAQDAQGGLARGGAGSEERVGGAVRYGGRVGARGYYRVYGKYFARDAFQGPAAQKADDDWRVWRGGFRADWEWGAHDAFSVQGGLFGGSAGQTFAFRSSSRPFWSTSTMTRNSRAAT